MPQDVKYHYDNKPTKKAKNRVYNSCYDSSHVGKQTQE